jgi:hypothetical protein
VPCGFILAPHLLGGNLEHVNGHMTQSAIAQLGTSEEVEMALGNVLVFSQMLAHASGKNRSNTIRFSAQVRFIDLAMEEFRDRKFQTFRPGNDNIIPEVPFEARFSPLAQR